jgi:hypothetical protein
MRITRIAVVAAGLTVGLAACTSGGSATPGASGSTGASGGASTGTSPGSATGSATGTPTPGVADSCVAGNWKSTGINGAFDAGAARGSVSGGSGVLVNVANSGATVVDFAGMQPVTFTTNAGGSELKGQFLYGGKVTGPVSVPAGTPTGVWKPAGPTDWTGLTVTVDMISPITGRIVDHVKVADFAGSEGGQTGGSVDVQPFLRESTYECSGNTLKLGPPPGATGGTWVLERA